MITAIIRNKENTLVLELPHSIYDIYDKLRSIGIRQPPKQIPLTDNEDENIGVKLFSESDFGQHLLLTLNEKNRRVYSTNMSTGFLIWSAKHRPIGGTTVGGTDTLISSTVPTLPKHCRPIIPTTA